VPDPTRDRVLRARIGGRVATLLLAAGSTIVCLLALELGARALGLRTEFFLRPSRSDCLRRSALLEWEFRPSCTGLLRDVPVHTNAAGLRGPELREDGSIRVLALGDSTTFGWTVPDDEAYPPRLERVLNRASDGTRYQVLNAGVAGYTSYQGLVYLRERGLGLKPAIVVIGFGFNELYRLGDDETRLARERLVLPVLRLNDFLVERSRLYRWLSWEASAAARSRLDYRVAPERYGENLREMTRLARGHGARVVLLDFFARPLVDAPERKFPEKLAAVSAELEAPLVVYYGPRLDVVHPTSAGYGILAHDIADSLERAGYISDARPVGTRAPAPADQ